MTIDDQKTQKFLFLCSALGVFLICIRIMLTSDSGFLFMIWNLFLGWLPLALSGTLAKTPRSKVRVVLILVAWILVLPNSFYMITDLFHLHAQRDVPLWLDLALLLSFAWTGVCFGMLSVRQVERYLTEVRLHPGPLVFIAFIMALNALGIYIGRYLRYNSWDVLSNPLNLASDMIYLLIHPFRNSVEWGMITIFSLLLIFMYLSLKKLSKAWE